MTKTWQLRALCVYLTLGLPLAASCAKEANTLEPDDTGSGATSSGGSTSKAGTTSKAGSTSAFGGTSGKAGSGAGGKAGVAGSVAADGGDSGTTAGTASGGKASGGTGGSGATMVPADVLARASAIVYYQTAHATAMDGTIQMKLFIKNQSPDPLPMDHVKIRYWFTAEVTTELHQYYTGPQAQQPKAAFVSAAKDSHALLTFGGGSIVMGGDMNASEVQLEISNNSGKFNQADDFSWNPADSAATPNDKVTLYLDDKLIWGCEPSGACFDDGGGAGGAGGQGAGGAP
jgi:Cellulose binding domain